jgi:hypothetical protein
MNGTFAIRIRRDSSNVVTFIKTGDSSPTTVGTLAGTINVNQIFAIGNTTGSSPGQGWGELALSLANTNAYDGSMSSYFNSKWALSLP